MQHNKYYSNDYKDTEVPSEDKDDSSIISGSGGGGSCFVKGTLVRTVNGYRPIDRLKVGDIVLAYDKYGTLGHGYISQVFKHPINEVVDGLYTVVLNNGTREYTLPETTGNHAFYCIADNEHKELKDFTVGETLVDLLGTECEIISISSRAVEAKDEYVYNLEITPQHTYFIGNGTDFIRVHNGGGSKPAASGAHEMANTMRSSAIARVLEVISEGPIVGLIGDAKGIYFNQTPLQNSDNSYNFAGVTVDGRTGLPDQTVVPGFTEILSVYAPGSAITVTEALPHVESIVGTNIDSAIVTIRFPQGLSYQEPTTGDLWGWYNIVAIDVRELPSGTFTEVVNDTIDGKAVTPVERDYRIRRPGAAGTSWAFRIRRAFRDPIGSQEQSLMQYARHTEIIEQSHTYPDTAIVGITIPAESVGNNIPVRGYLTKGLLVQVPSNYNPVTKVYTGLWNGLFTYAWTDNTAYILYELLTNERWGVAGYLNQPIEVDKWSFYYAGVYNDELVPDGVGGYENRYTFNAVISVSTDAWQLLHAVAANMRAVLARSSNGISLIQDRPTDSVKIVTNSNVVNGVFNYATSNSTTRTTSVNVTFNDRLDRYLPRTVSLENSTVANPSTVNYGNGIEIHGYNNKDVLAYGVVDESRALRLARWELYTAAKEYELVTFSQGLNVVDIQVGDVISVLDNDYISIDTEFLAGRIVSIVDNVVTLDVPVTLSASGYTFGVNNIDYTGIHEATILETAGVYTVLTLQTAPPAGDYSNHEFYCFKTGVIVPRKFRISGISETERGVYTISAMVYEESKYDAIESGLLVDDYNYSTIPVVPTPTGLHVTENYRSDGVLTKSVVALVWDYNANIYSYTLRVRRQFGDFDTYENIKTNFKEWEDVLPGTYEFELVAHNLVNHRSQPATLSYEYRLSQTSSLLPPVNFYVSGTSGTVFDTPDFTAYFDYNTTNDTKVDKLRDYIVEVYNENGETLYNSYVLAPFISEPHLKGSGATYTHSAIYNDFGYAVMPRTFQIWAYSRDILGKVSVPLQVTFTNPAPAYLTGLVITGWERTVIIDDPTYIAPRDSFQVIVSASASSGFNYADRANWYHIGPVVNNVTIMAPAYGTYYVRVAISDGYDDNTLNWSAEHTVVCAAGSAVFDFEAPGVPTGVTATQYLHQLPTGETVVDIRVAWTASTGRVSTYTLGYLDYTAGETQYHYLDSAEPFMEFKNVVPGHTYRAIVRGNFGDAHSSFSTYISVSTTGDVTPPAAPTGLDATDGHNTITVNWINPTDVDFDMTEVWASQTNDRATATLMAKTRSTFYAWGNIPNGQVWYAWARSLDKTGNASAWYPASATAGILGTSTPIGSSDIDSGLVTSIGNGDIAWTGTINYRLAGAPSNNPSPQDLVITANTNGTRDIRVGWNAYTQGAVPADYIIIFYHEGSTALTVNDSNIILPVQNGQAGYHTFLGASYREYRAGIAAARRSDNGLIIGTIIQPVPNLVAPGGTGNYTDNVNSVSAATVTGQAANGAASYDGTVLYRTGGAPSNNPVPSLINITTNTNGTRDIKLTWSAYVQGARPADMIVLFYKEGTTSLTVNDSAIAMNVNTVGASYYLFQGVDPSKAYRAGIAAARKTESGLEIGPIVQPTATPDWAIDVGEVNYTAKIGGVMAATVNSNIATAATTAVWTGVTSRPTDAEIMNEQMRTNANLVPGLTTWAHGGTNWTDTNSSWHVDRTALIIPGDSVGVVSTVTISTAADQRVFNNTSYKLSFKAWCAGGTRSLSADLFPDTLPESIFTLNATPTEYTVDWLPSHTDINGTVTLRFFSLAGGTQIHIGDIQLELGTVKTPWKPNVKDFININNRATAINYKNFLAAGSVSGMAFSQNVGTSGVGDGATISTALTFDSDGNNVVVMISARLVNTMFDSLGGYSRMTLTLTVNGSTVFNLTSAQVPNSTGDNIILVSGTQFVYVATPGAGNVTYSLTATYNKTGNGISGVVQTPTLQVIGLKR